MDILLFKLPGELRDRIYDYYFFLEDGYEYNHDTAKLRCRKVRPYPFALSYTCKAICQETRGMPMQANILVFEPYFPCIIRDWSRPDGQEEAHSWIKRFLQARSIDLPILNWHPPL